MSSSLFSKLLKKQEKENAEKSSKKRKQEDSDDESSSSSSSSSSSVSKETKQKKSEIDLFDDSKHKKIHVSKNDKKKSKKKEHDSISSSSTTSTTTTTTKTPEPSLLSQVIETGNVLAEKTNTTTTTADNDTQFGMEIVSGNKSISFLNKNAKKEPNATLLSKLTTVTKQKQHLSPLELLQQQQHQTNKSTTTKKKSNDNDDDDDNDVDDKNIFGENTIKSVTTISSAPSSTAKKTPYFNIALANNWIVTDDQQEVEHNDLTTTTIASSTMTNTTSTTTTATTSNTMAIDAISDGTSLEKEEKKNVSITLDDIDNEIDDEAAQNAMNTLKEQLFGELIRDIMSGKILLVPKINPNHPDVSQMSRYATLFENENLSALQLQQLQIPGKRRRRTKTNQPASQETADRLSKLLFNDKVVFVERGGKYYYDITFDKSLALAQSHVAQLLGISPPTFSKNFTAVNQNLMSENGGKVSRNIWPSRSISVANTEIQSLLTNSSAEMEMTPQQKKEWVEDYEKIPLDPSEKDTVKYTQRLKLRTCLENLEQLHRQITLSFPCKGN